MRVLLQGFFDKAKKVGWLYIKTCDAVEAVEFFLWLTIVAITAESNQFDVDVGRNSEVFQFIQSSAKIFPIVLRPFLKR